MKSDELLLPVFGLMGLLLLGGCSPSVASMDESERGDALMKRAGAYAQAGDVDSAIRLYMRLIDVDPGVARAHLDAAILFDDYKKECVRAIYHYQRYLELRPQTEKKAMIENRIRQASQRFAASVVKPGRHSAPPQDIADLKKENAALREQIQQLQREVEAAQRVRMAPPAPAPRPAAAPGPATVSGPPPAAGAPVKHTVQAGERLHALAATYGVSVQSIMEANGLADPNKIRIGQVLVIPPPAAGQTSGGRGAD